MDADREVMSKCGKGRPEFTHAVQLRTFIVSILCRLWRGYDHSKILTGGQPLGTGEG